MMFLTEVHSEQPHVTVEPDATRDKNIRYNGFPHCLRETLSGSLNMLVQRVDPFPGPAPPRDGTSAHWNCPNWNRTPEVSFGSDQRGWLWGIGLRHIQSRVGNTRLQ